jgi:hypothetical protein
MKLEVVLPWVVTATAFFFLLVWLGVRAIRWSKRRSTAADVLGLGMSLPGAMIDPESQPQKRVEEVKKDTQRRKDSGGADPNRP